jgi:hypothetical protein
LIGAETVGEAVEYARRFRSPAELALRFREHADLVDRRRRPRVRRAVGLQAAPVGIPTVRDRVVQAALKLVLEPIFEANFKPCSYGFRPRHRAQDTIHCGPVGAGGRVQPIGFRLLPHRPDVGVDVLAGGGLGAYKLRILAEYEAAPNGNRVRSCAGRACIPRM